LGLDQFLKRIGTLNLKTSESWFFVLLFLEEIVLSPEAGAIDRLTANKSGNEVKRSFMKRCKTVEGKAIRLL
jgi:hypothetical protein